MISFLLPATYLCAIGFCLYTAIWLTVRADKNPTTRALAVCQALVILWCIPQLFLPFPMTREARFQLYCISYIGISLIGPAWLTFSALYCRRRVGAGLKGLLFGISAADYGMLLTNDFHQLFYQSFERVQVCYGPVFYFHMVYTYVCILAGMALIAREFGKGRAPVKLAALILPAAAIPLGFNFLYIVGVVKSGFDLTPPAFAVSSFLLLLAVFRYDFLDTNVLTFEHIFESIAEGVVIYNRRGIITYCNQAAEGWLGVRTGEGFARLQERLSLDGILIEPYGEAEQENKVLSLESGDKIRLRQYIYRNKRGIVTAGAILLTDVGEYYQLLQQNRELAISRQRLAIEQEQNRIAQEVHDTAGHTLTMIRSLLKLIGIGLEERCGWPKDAQGRKVAGESREAQGFGAEDQLEGAGVIERQEEELREYVAQAQALAAEGIRQLRQAIKNMRQETGRELVTQGVFQLSSTVKEIPVEVEIQGEDGPEYSHLSSVIYKCLREGITNCLKYAEASHIDVIVKFEKEGVSLFLLDDGKGCDNIQESDGLRGIRRRVEQAGGKLRIFSERGEGFQIYMNLPLKGGEVIHDSDCNCR